MPKLIDRLRGITLIEIAVVLAILVTVSAATVVSFTSGLSALKLEAEARKVLADISWARQRVIATRIGHALHFDQAGKKYFIYKSLTGKTSDFTSSNLLNEVVLNVSLSLTQANLWVYSPKGNMWLDDGSTGRDTIPFANQGRTKNIKVFAETGNVKLE